MRKLFFSLLILLCLAAYGCDSTGLPAAPTETPGPTNTAVPPTSTPWVPPTALAGTPRPGAEATLTAAPSLNHASLTITNGLGETVNMRVELADNEPAREIGLMFRPSLPPDEGMLFDFQGDTTSGFWMENTILPLSIAFIDKDGTIIDIQDMQALNRNSISAPAPYRYALETNQGFFRAHNIVVGNKVIIGSDTTQSVVVPGMPGCGR